MTFKRPKTKYGFSFHQDFALTLCIKEYGTCPYGCSKTGAPNCHAIVNGIFAGWEGNQCEPGRRTQQQADEYEAQLRWQEEVSK